MEIVQKNLFRRTVLFWVDFFRVDFLPVKYIRADFREGDEDSNFSLSRVRRFTESPEPLH